MIHDVVSATYKGEYKIEVTFDDGEAEVVDFSKCLDKGASLVVSRILISSGTLK